MASKRKKRRKQCGNKRKFQSQEEGFKEAGRLRKRFPGQTFDTYRCPHCGNFHVGHRPKSVNQAITKRRDQR